MKGIHLLTASTTVCFAALLVSAFASSSARAQAVPKTADTAPGISSAAVAEPYLTVTKHEEVDFSVPAKLTLHTWQIQSDGIGYVEARIW